MNHKDHVMIAQVIRMVRNKHPNSRILNDLVATLAMAFSLGNPRFNPISFVTLCSVEKKEEEKNAHQEL